MNLALLRFGRRAAVAVAIDHAVGPRSHAARCLTPFLVLCVPKPRSRNQITEDVFAMWPHHMPPIPPAIRFVGDAEGGHDSAAIRQSPQAIAASTLPA